MFLKMKKPIILFMPIRIGKEQNIKKRIENQESMASQKDYLQLFKRNACSKKQVIQALIGRIQRMYGKK